MNARQPVLLLALVPVLAAQDGWTVPAQPEPLVIEAPAFVTTLRVRENQLESPANDLVLRDLLPEGTRVVRGQRVAVFDTSRAVAELPVRRHDLAIAEAEGRRQVLEAEGRIAGLEAQRTSLQADLAAARAALASLGRDQESQAALAQARAAQAALAVAAARRKAAVAALGAQAGDRSADDARSAEHRAAQADLERQEAEAVAEASLGSASLLRRRKELERRIAGLCTSLGVVPGPQGDVADAGSGIERQLVWARDALERVRSSTREQVAARRASLQEGTRNTADSVPLAWLTATPAAGGEARRLDVIGSAGGTPAPGWQAERGEAWDPRRGYGWQAPPSDAALPSEGTPAADPAATVRVLDAPAVFWWQLPPGTWRIEVGLGDRDEWNGAVVAVDGVGIIHASNRIKADAPVTATATVTVAGAPVVLRFGDEPGRGLRAPSNGLLLHAHGLRRGGKAGWARRPIAWIADPAAVRVEARVAAALQPLFTTGTATTGPLAALAVRQVEILQPDGAAPVPATVSDVGVRPVSLRATVNGWDDQEAAAQSDGVAREITAVPEQGDRLSPRSAVVLRARVPLPPGVWAVPPHLVGRSRDGAWVRTTFGRRAVTAQALGPATLVLTGLKAGDRLRPVGPTGNPAEDDDLPPPPPAGQYTGRIIAGARSGIPAPATWGRVQEMLPDGTDVVAGQQIMVLYNPWLEGRVREQADARRRVAEATAREERERTDRAEAAATERRSSREAERTARLALADLEEPPPSDRLVAAPLRATRAQAEVAWTRERAAALEPLGGQARQDADTSAQRAALSATRTRLDAASVGLPPWLDVAGARNAWWAALDQLSLRPGRDAVAAGQSRAGLLAAAARRGSGQWELDVAADFARLRRITAPVAGRLHWLDGYSDQTRGMASMARDLSVWGGMPLGEILDLAVLDVTLEVPEERYATLAPGQRLTVTLPERGDARLTATVTAIGGMLAPPADRRDSVGQLVADSRVVTVRARLDPAPGLQPPPVPGLRALIAFTPTGDRP